MTLHLHPSIGDVPLNNLLEYAAKAGYELRVKDQGKVLYLKKIENPVSATFTEENVGELVTADLTTALLCRDLILDMKHHGFSSHQAWTTWGELDKRIMSILQGANHVQSNS